MLHYGTKKYKFVLVHRLTSVLSALQRESTIKRKKAIRVFKDGF
jgi:hypothetical protein